MFIVVLITCPIRNAEEIAKKLLEERLVACVNIARVKSFFWWKGKVDEAEESLLIAKTRSALLEKLMAKVREIHPYEVPEMIALPVCGGLEEYLKWVEEETSRA